MNGWSDIALRLGAALVGSMLLGLNRELHGKPTGMRTLGLVGLSAAVATLAATGIGSSLVSPEAASRVLQGVIQGVLTGVGFIGAGVILRDGPGMRVHGLTTAATVLVTAALGVVDAGADRPGAGAGSADCRWAAGASAQAAFGAAGRSRRRLRQ
jgi:putative Mg2+ transporter-C (MgtC) family protein